MTGPFLNFVNDGGALKFPLGRVVNFPLTLYMRTSATAPTAVVRYCVDLSRDPWNVSHRYALGHQKSIGQNRMLWKNETNQKSMNTGREAWREMWVSSVSGSSHRMKINDASSTQAQAVTSTDFDTLYIGGGGDGLNDWQGQVKDVALWDIQLDDTEFALLERGYSPEHIRRGNLVCYLPLSGDLIEVVSGRSAEKIFSYAEDWEYSGGPVLPTIRRPRSQGLSYTMTGKA